MSFGLQKNPGTTAKSPYDFQGITVRVASVRSNPRPAHTSSKSSPAGEGPSVLPLVGSVIVL